MAFSLIYPRSNTNIQLPTIAFGQLGPSVPSVTGRLISYTPSTVIYAVRMDQLAPKFWRLVFDGLLAGDTYDLEILSQNGQIIDAATNLTVAAFSANIQIDYPGNGATVCPDLIAVGTTTRTADPLGYMRVSKPNVPTVHGVEDLRLGNVWQVRFMGIPQGTGYTLQVGHEADGSDVEERVIDVHISACTPTPTPTPIPGPGPGPIPVPPPGF